MVTSFSSSKVVQSVQTFGDPDGVADGPEGPGFQRLRDQGGEPFFDFKGVNGQVVKCLIGGGSPLRSALPDPGQAA
jgi:hypothetical protein